MKNNKQTQNIDFKLQHPQDLISRLFILEYIRELGVDIVREKLDNSQHLKWIYSFEAEDGEKSYDFNWEYLLFVIPLDSLGKTMEKYLDQIEEIEAKRQEKYAEFREKQIQEELSKPVDINVYDLAQSDIKNQSKKLI